MTAQERADKIEQLLRLSQWRGKKLHGKTLMAVMHEVRHLTRSATRYESGGTRVLVRVPSRRESA